MNKLRRSTKESGSVYLLSLIALVVLTIMGLVLSMITQTEMQMGANERPVQRVFYAAGAGIAASTSRALVSAEYDGRSYELEDQDASLILDVRNEVEVTPFYPILDAPCNLCEINNSGTYNERSYRRIDHALTATAQRLAGANATVLAQKTVSTMIEVQPWRTGPEAYLYIDNPNELEKIRF